MQSFVGGMWVLGYNTHNLRAEVADAQLRRTGAAGNHAGLIDARGIMQPKTNPATTPEQTTFVQCQLYRWR